MKPVRKIIWTLSQLHYTDWINIVLLVYIIQVLILFTISYSVDIQGMEFAFLNHIQLIEKNKTLYTNPDAFPFSIVFYPPIYPFTLHWLTKILKINVFQNIHELLVSIRILSLIFALINGFLIFRITRLILNETKYKLLLFIVFLLLLPQHFFAVRPDSAKVLFFLLFINYAIKYSFYQKNKSNLFFATLYATIGVFLKHDILFYILIFWVTHYLILHEKRDKRALLLLFIFIFAGLLICNDVFGKLFFKNILYYNIQYSSDIKVNLLFIIANTARLAPFVLFSFLNYKSTDVRIKFIGTLSLIYFIFSNLTLLRTGSNLNYTYESVILMIVNFSIYLHYNKKSWKKYYQIPLLLLILFFNTYLKEPKIFDQKLNEQLKTDYYSDLQTSKELKEIIKNDTVFFPNGKYIIFYSELNLLYGYDLHFDRFCELYFKFNIKPKLYTNNSIKRYDQLFSDGTVKYLVIDDNKVAKEQINKYYKNYYFYKKVGNLLLYKI